MSVGTLLLAAAVIWLGSAVIRLMLGKERAFGKSFFAGLNWEVGGMCCVPCRFWFGAIKQPQTHVI